MDDLTPPAMDMDIDMPEFGKGRKILELDVPRMRMTGMEGHGHGRWDNAVLRKRPHPHAHRGGEASEPSLGGGLPGSGRTGMRNQL